MWPDNASLDQPAQLSNFLTFSIPGKANHLDLSQGTMTRSS